jgi:hypothetical protein
LTVYQWSQTCVLLVITILITKIMITYLVKMLKVS